MPIRRRGPVGPVLAMLVGLVATLVGGGAAHADSESCSTPPELTVGDAKLPRLAERLKAHQPVTIVAIGGASTLGQAAGSSDLSYPHKLEEELARLFPDTPVSVVNKGVPRQSARQMMERFPTDVFAEDPVLVVWELGITDAVRGTHIDDFAGTLQDGIAQLKNRAIDSMLVDMQFARSSTTLSNFDDYFKSLHRISRLADTYVFPRFALMRYWNEHQVFNMDDVAAEDRAAVAAGIYACLGQRMAEVIQRSTP